MIARLFACVAGIVTFTPASAQELNFDISSTLACLEEAVGYGEVLDCPGASTRRCSEENPGAGSDWGMAECAEIERQYWDARLNEVYGRLRQAEREEDAVNEGTSNFTSQADALRDMQRAWIAYRDQRCNYILVQWSGGTGGNSAYVGCLMRQTAEQVFFLEQMIEVQ